ncbi:MAG TPA: aminotransferase class III-fold pyridoxal phosphate-dependent enzyme [Capillimicrobium sp.]|nr:aminotransferase class III-fold pyridoxal phosphate-dependent enzyme [Capillimicrobium sp.]
MTSSQVQTPEEEYAAKRPRSAAMWERAQGLLAAGVSHTNRRTYPFPSYYERAAGARKWDVDGNEYVDYNLASGSLVLGHANPVVTERLHARLDLGTPMMCHETELDWAALVQELIPAAERVRFVVSGTEATKLAMRTARAFTGRPKVARFEGHFHGWHDYVLHGYRQPFEQPVSDGVLADVTGTVLPIPLAQGLEGAARMLERGDVALLILEPTGPTWGTVPFDAAFLQGLRDLCDQHGTLLMFDEVITGFRVSPGGAQAERGVVPDLTSLGKALTGGLPGGALVGRADVMDLFRPGREGPYVFHFSTFSGHPLTATAGVATLEQLRDGAAHAVAGGYAEQLRGGINDLIAQLGLRGFAYGEASMFHVYLESPDVARDGQITIDDVSPYDLLAMSPLICERLAFQLRLRGVDLVAFNGGFTSSAHREGELDQTLSAFEGALTALRDGGVVATAG